MPVAMPVSCSLKWKANASYVHNTSSYYMQIDQIAIELNKKKM